MSEGPTFNQTTNGGSPQVNQGVNINNPTNQTNAGETDWRPPFIELADQVEGKSWPEETPAYISEEYETPRLAVDAAVQEIKNDLESDDPISDEAFEEKRTDWEAKFKALLPIGIKVTSSVGIALTSHFTKRTAVGVAAEAFFKSISEFTR